MGRLYIFWCAR